jgi:hypothetical protein
LPAKTNATAQWRARKLTGFFVSLEFDIQEQPLQVDRKSMSNAKPVDVLFVDPRILSAIEDEKFIVRATRRIGETYQIDFGYGAFYATLAVKKGEVTEQTLADLTKHAELLRKVVANYTVPKRYDLVSAAFASGTAPKLKARAYHA